MPHAHTPEEPNDVEMISVESPAIVGQRAESSRLNPGNETSKTKAVRGLPIAEKYSPGNLIKTTLNTPITVPIGELMAQSAELRKQMIKELQTRTIRIEEGKENDAQNRPSTLNSAHVNSLTTRPESKKPDERASLVMIKVNLGLGDRKLWVNAIVDSESEVNIISRPVAKELNKDYPVMPLEEARCADTNGNQGILTGKFSDVLLFQGSVVTNAALFMGSYKVNFQMLLGRPWIRGNMVSMKEKIDGTYLVYEDPYNTGKQMELLVVPKPWDTHLEGPIPSYYVEQDDLEFEGSWRLEDSEAIVPAGISQFNAYLSHVTPPDNPMILKGRDDDVQSLES
ncbi:hypothetical protein ARMGADRAFT_1090341 [Armillaria gallica]|uniref:Uncharacterized protein n=1 Tax=Armillaria gallica TaxID=47427 RepID=A0A2H3CVI6_ARMGA|nr:hypothetical protein ARMGADRAFT_1090341 [Armillaria gallica]